MKVNFFKAAIFIILICIILIKTITTIREKKAIRVIEDRTGLKMPVRASSLKYEINRMVDESSYPYVFFAKFTTSKDDYLAMVRPLLINRLDTNNIIYLKTSGSIFCNKDFFWGFENFKEVIYPAWWGNPQQSDFSLLFANVLSDNPETAIGRIDKYNGMIVTYFKEPFCFILVNCWPVQVE
ncbi:MAG: hypothetical protein J0M10_09800 [Chitinophagales bacterium]|nr:hypothetical protein [Chitinophagales bacterium]